MIHVILVFFFLKIFLLLSDFFGVNMMGINIKGATFENGIAQNIRSIK